MALRYPGGFISNTAPTVNANTAKGVWTLEEAMQYIKAGNWPSPTGNGDPYFQYNTILLPGQGTNGTNNNTFLDSSTNNFTITRNGNTTQGTFTPFSQASGYWANYLGTTSNYFYLNGEAGFAFGSSADFTIEFFFYANSLGGDVVFYDSRPTSTNGVYATLYYNNSSKVISYVVSSADRITGTSVISTSQWHHVVLSRLSGNTRLFVDGVQQGSTYSDTNNYANPSGRPTVCASGFSAAGYLDGYISNFRVLNGTGVSSVTVPTSPFAINTTNQILLIASSNRFVDANTATTAKTINIGGSPQVTPFEPFGAPTSAYSAATVGGSGYFDGSGDYLTVASNTAFNMGTGDFTVECWVYTNSTGNLYPTFLAGGSAWTSGSSGHRFSNTGAANKFTFHLNGATPGDPFLTSTNTFPHNSWNYYALTRSGNTWRMFINGVQEASGTYSGSFDQGVNGMTIGWSPWDAGNGYYLGYVSGLRITKGAALYTSGFTPPTAPSTTTVSSGTVSLLTSFTNAGIIDNAEKNDLETVGNAQISTSQYKWGASSMYFDGNGDYLIVPVSQNYVMGTGDFTIETWLRTDVIPSTTYDTVFDTRPASTNGAYLQLYLDTDGKLKLWVSSADRITASSALEVNTWYHVVVARTGRSTKMFINGNQTGSTYADTTNYIASNLIIGASYGGGSSISYGFTGYMADFRITKGYDRYPYNFTAPTAAFPLFYQAAATPSSDPYFENTTLLLPGNGTNGAQNNTFLDSSTNAFTITRNGNTTQGTFTPFSQTGWSNYFDGTGDYLTVANNSAFDVGAGDFCVETWFYAASVSSQQFLFTWSSAGTGLELELKASGELGFSLGTGSWVYTNQAAGNIQANSWTHVAYVRASGTLSIFINGVRTFTAANSSTVGNPSTTVSIGAYRASSNYLNGYMSNFRFVKGSGVYNPSQTTITVPTSPLTAVSGTSLLTCQSNRFIDNSSNAFTITRNGDTSVQAFSPFNPTASYSTSTVGGSGYFDGSGDYLSVASNAAFQLGSGDFTIECWVYPTIAYNGSTTQQVMISRWNTGSLEYLLDYQAGNFRFYDTNASHSVTGAYTGGSEWIHIAAVRNGSTTTLYINGVSKGTSTAMSFSSYSTPLLIGFKSDGSSEFFTGYMSSPRIVKGTAVYTSNFTPPTAPLTAISNTSLLLNYTNGGITDATAKNDLETVGGASISTTQSKFGGSSMYFDGTGDWTVMPGSPKTYITGDVTIEFWAYFNALASNPLIVGWAAVNADGKTFLYTYSDGSIAIGRTGVNEIKSSAGVLTTGSWIHIAVARYGSTTTIYKNGVSVVSSTTDVWTSGTSASYPFYVGGSGIGAANVYINDVRVTNGIARYTQNFTPPSSAFLTL